MARDFGTSKYAAAGSALVTAAPLTIAGWFMATGTAEMPILEISDGTNASSLFMLELDGASHVGAQATTGATEAVSTTTYSTNVWNHAAGVFTSSTSRAAFLNGGSKGTNSTSGTPSGMTNTWISNDRGVRFFIGALAEIGLWNVALTDNEIAALAKGALPRSIRPAALVGYWPLWGLASPEPDMSGGGHNMTLTGSPAQGNHAPAMLFTPRRRTYPQFDVAAAGNGLLLRRRRAAA